MNWRRMAESGSNASGVKYFVSENHKCSNKAEEWLRGRVGFLQRTMKLRSCSARRVLTASYERLRTFSVRLRAFAGIITVITAIVAGERVREEMNMRM